LQSGTIGINQPGFIMDQLAIVSAQMQTNRVLLASVLSNLTNVNVDSVLDNANDMDVDNLLTLYESAPKFTKG